MAYLKHKFGKTYYITKGKKGKTPIVVLHGGPGGRHTGNFPLHEMAKDRKIYFYDQMGGGKSSPTDKKYWNIKSFVEELSLLLDHWGLDEFHLYGSSWGTTLALEYYLRKKGKGVKSITFQSPMFSAKDWSDDAKKLVKQLDPKYQKIINYCHEIGATDSKVYKEAVIEYYSNFVFRNKAKLKKAISNPNPHGNEVYDYMWGPSEFNATGTLKTYDRVSDLSKIEIPTFLICGQYDEARPETAFKYSKKIKGSEFTVMPNCSHAILGEKPKPLIAEYKRFIKSIED